MAENPTYEKSERQREEEALRESEEKYHLLFELESDAIFLIEKDTGKILEANASAANIYGFSREELLRMKNVDLSAELKKTKQATQDQLALIPIRYHRKKDGTVFPVEITASHLNWKGREAHIAAIRDISFRVKAESALRESEKRYRTLFESSRDAIMTLAPPSWLFTSGNPASVELFRVRDEAEFISLGPWQLSPERQPEGKPSAEKAMEMIETAMRNGSHFFEWTHCHSDGTSFPTEVLLTRMEQEGQVLLQASVRDINNRKQEEEKRNRLISYLQKALSEVKTLRGFLPICSHCKKIRDDKGYWNQIESYIHKHSDAEFSHGICPECAKKYYPDMDLYEDEKTQG